MIGYLTDHDWSELNDFIEKWVLETQDELEEEDTIFLETLWSFLKDKEIAKNSFDLETQEEFLELWQSDPLTVEEWFLFNYEIELEEMPEELQKVLKYLWLTKNPKETSH